LTHICKCSWAATPHETYGACLRSKGMHVAPSATPSASGIEAGGVRKWDRRLERYRDARKAGITPASTRSKHINQAVRISDRTGTAFDASAVAG